MGSMRRFASLSLTVALSSACLAVQYESPTGGSGGSGGAGQGGASCELDCDDDNVCTDDFCASETVCGHAPSSQPPAQLAGDCRTAVCDGTTLRGEVDLSDVPPDTANPCRASACLEDGTPTQVNVDGTCGTDGAFLCLDGTCTCNVSADCTDYETECANAECVGNLCVVSYEAAGTVVADDGIAGNCAGRVCDGVSPVSMLSVTPLDLPPANGNPCQVAACVEGVPAYINSTIHSPCPGGFCDGGGSCVECNDLSDCGGATPICVANQCVECGVDADCPGGGVCLPSNECVQCVTNGDCATAQQGSVCIAGECGCNGNADCPDDESPYCNTEDSFCAACVTNTHCNGNPDGERCISFLGPIRCGCQSAGDCPGNSTCGPGFACIN